MNIEIKNCNNIDSGAIAIKENTLNIKYAINGTGKSTISKAIFSSVADRLNGKDSLSDLTPFKKIGLIDEEPQVTGTETFSKIRIFDERYINEFVFQADELLKGSFDIFIRDENYENGLNEIDNKIAVIKSLLSEDEEISALIADFNELSSSFGKTTKSGIHGSSNVAKALKDGNKVHNIPTGLESYKLYIQHSENYKWIKWQLDGKSYVDLSSDCPYCTSDIEEKKATIKLVSQVYEHKAIENLNKIVAVFQRLNEYFSDEAKARINEFVICVDGYSDDQINYLREVKDQIERLNEKFIRAQRLGFSSLKDVDKVIEELKTYKIDINLFVHLNSVLTIQKIGIVNNAIENILVEAGELQGSIARQKAHIAKVVKENCDGINGFLRNAGYHYNVKLLEDQNGQHRLKLLHNDGTAELNNVRNHLSFGERNAFSLVLFMYDALKESPDMIVLDDPISSFDKNKKYAIIEMLFRKESSFRGKTVLLLTHDFDPIVDMVYQHTDRFIKPFATFLENKHGSLIEKEIVKSDIKNFVSMNLDNASLDIHVINRLVYLRRYFEVINNNGLDYDVISNLFHKRNPLTLRENLFVREMTSEEITNGCNLIRQHLPNFDYPTLFSIVSDDIQMKELYATATNNYEKLHIYRIIFEGKAVNIESNIIQKFINEAFHIENNYIYQLNPCKYQLVPQYVIDECDSFVALLH